MKFIRGVLGYTSREILPNVSIHLQNHIGSKKTTIKISSRGKGRKII